jgi:outer membrane usher protein
MALGYAMLLHGTPVAAQEPLRLALDFNEQLLPHVPGGPRVDVSRFSLGNPLQPGSYRTDIFLNGLWLVRSDVLIQLDAPGLRPYACLNKFLVSRLGIDPTALSAAAQRLLGLTPPADGTPSQVPDASPPCLALDQIIADGSSHFEPSEQRLDLTVPQALIARRARGYVDPESWDYGVNAALLNYRLSNYQSQSGTATTSQSYLGLNAGVNLAGWQLRHDGNLVDGNGAGTHYQSINTYLRHDVVALRSTFVLGDAYTDGQLFDSYSLQGVTLASDDRMLPDSQRGFAPTVRGQAFSQANVQVRQSGILLYETSVSPGPFVINDLYPTGFGGDLEVTVTEADGSRHTSQVAYSASPQLLRDGGLRYSLSAGRYRQSVADLQVVQGQLQYGLSNALTAEGGVSASKEYAAYLLGVAFNTSLGAMALDYTRSQFTPPGQQTRSGDSWRASWSKLFEPTRTNFSVAAYRYSSEDFYTLQNAADTLNRTLTAPLSSIAGHRVQSNLKLAINQSMGRWGALYLSGISTSYWAEQGVNNSVQLGYTQQLGRVALTLGVNQQAASLNQKENAQVFVSLIVPLDANPNRSGAVSLTQTHDDLRGDSTQANYWGSGGEGHAYSYGLFATHATAQDTAGGNLSYRSNFGLFGVGVSSSATTTTGTLAAEGGLVLHAGGLTAANTLGDTVGLVRVDDGQGIEVQGNQGAPVDANGYTVVRYLNAYAANTVVLDMSKASLDTQLDATDQVVAPHAGSVVLVHFNTLAGHTILIEGHLAAGGPLPFGADVLDQRKQSVGSVGQGGRLEARLTQAQGQLTVKWGDSADQQCVLDYAIPAGSDHQHQLVQLKAICKPLGAARTERLSSALPALPAMPAIHKAPDAKARGALLTIRLPDGTFLPKGAVLMDPSGSQGASGAGGRVYVKPAQVREGLLASWTDGLTGVEHACPV